nr:hypothetical protein [Tanacetum cinerariifolium]
VANAARNYEILYERDDDDTERPDKRQKSGDRHQPTSQQSSHGNHGHNNGRHGSDRRVCTTCGRRHPGECRRATGTCFKCGQASHLQKDCKKNTTVSTSGQADKKPGASGRVFAITEGHATNTSGTITGTLFIYGHAVFVLFDTGATHSVISFAFASRVTTTPMLIDHDYDTNIQYHPRKANVVADALSRKSGMIAGIKHGYWASLRVEPDLISRIKEAQKEDSEIWTIVENLDKQVEFHLDDDNVLWQDTRLVVPNDASLREAQLTKAHSSPFSVHPGALQLWYSEPGYKTAGSKDLTCNRVRHGNKLVTWGFIVVLDDKGIIAVLGNKGDNISVLGSKGIMA